MKSTEQTTSLFQVAEISISYSSVIKPSQRPKISSSPHIKVKVLTDNRRGNQQSDETEIRRTILDDAPFGPSSPFPFREQEYHCIND